MSFSLFIQMLFFIVVFLPSCYKGDDELNKKSKLHYNIYIKL